MNGGETCRSVVGKAERNRQLARSSHRCKFDIKMGLRERMEWVELAQDRDQQRALVNAGHQ
jgi:hypothetical protein